MGDFTLDLNDDGLDRAKPSDLQSLIIFGLDNLHSGSMHQATDDDPMPQMAQVVQQALLQRGKVDGDASGNENRISDPELEENLYAFEGQDFTPKKRKDIDETNENQPQDEAVLNSWVQKLDIASADEELASRKGRKRSIGEPVATEKDRAAKQQKMEMKRKAKWDTLGYKSLAVQDPGEVAVGMHTDDSESKLHFVFGDCTKPSVGHNEPAVIFSVVDNSGIWGSGGMFSALNKLSPYVQEAYEAAHVADDLHVNDLHLISIDDSNDNKKRPGEDEEQIRFWVGLGVVQSYDRRRKSARSDISLPALEACLRKIAGSAAAMNASIHMPRISSGQGQDRKEWYAIERLLRKHASQSAVPIYVYYYKRPDRHA